MAIANLSLRFDSVSKARSQRRNKPETKPFCIRLTDDERACLREKANHEHLSSWARGVLLGQNARKRRTARQPKISDKNLALVMALLGDQRIASNLNQLARHANMGTLDYDEETRPHAACVLHALRGSRSAMIAIRNYLIGE